MAKMGGGVRTRRKRKLFMIWGVDNKVPCWWCLKILDNDCNATIEHLIPQSLGGQHNIENLRIACADCNSNHVNPLDVMHLIAHKIEWINP